MSFAEQKKPVAPPATGGAMSAPGRLVSVRQDNIPFERERSDFRLTWAIAGILVLIVVESVISAFSYPYFSLALEDHGLSNWLIGLNASFAGAGILMVGPFLPRLIAVLGLPRFAAAMYAVPVLCFAVILVFDDVAIWFASRFVMGACFAALWATTEIWLNGLASDHQRGRVMSLAMVLYTGAQFVGPLMINATGVVGYLPLVAAMAPLAAAAIVALAIREGPSTGPGDLSAVAGRLGFRAAFSLARSLIIASFLVGVASTAIYSLLPLFGVSRGLDDEAASTLVAVFGLGEAMLVLVVGFLADRYGRWELLKLCAIPTLAIAIALPFVATVIPALVVLLFVAGGTLGAIYTLGLILIGQDFKGHSLAVVSTGFAMAYSAGAVVGATPIGYLIDLYGPNALPVAIAASLLLLAYFAYRGEEIRVRLDRPVTGLAQDNRPASAAADDGEAVDIEEAEVGDLEVRDDRQGKERDLEEWFLERASEATRRAAERREPAADGLERPEAHQTGKRKGKIGKHFAA